MSKKLGGWGTGSQGAGHTGAGHGVTGSRGAGHGVAGRCAAYDPARRHRETCHDDERGQVISTLILTIPVLLLIFLVFFIFTTSQSASVAQVSADAAVIHIQEILSATHPQELPDELRNSQAVEDGLLPLPEDDPTTVRDERKEAFIDLVTSDWLIEVGRREIYSRMCASSRWVVGDACFDWGTNIPRSEVLNETNNCPQPETPEGAMPLTDNWPDVKVWISFPDLPLPVLSDPEDMDDPNKCLSNPLDSISRGSHGWNDMLEYPLERWRIVVLVELHPVMPALITFIAEQPVRRAISCGPLFLAGSDPELWKC